MARPLRLQFAGAIYHLTSRGNAGNRIFIGDFDRTSFLKVLAKVVERYKWKCHGYCLMNNHYHLIVETLTGNLARGMKYLNGVYTQRYNKIHVRHGHIFQGRYSSILIEKDSHLLEVVRYVANNPVRVGLVSNPGDWEWGSYRYLIGGEELPLFLTGDWILSQFGPKRSLAIKRLKVFVNQSKKIDESLWDRLTGSVYFGDEAFVKNHLTDKSSTEVPRSQREPIRCTLKVIMKRKATYKEIEAALKEGYRLSEIAAYLGVHYSTISQRIRRYKAI